MCSEIDQFSSFLRRMSDNRQIFPVERKDDDKEGIIISELTPDSHPQIVPESETAVEEREKENLEDEADRQKQTEEIKNKEDETDKLATVSHNRESDDDGYETPTSSDHRIPAITQCPPAPMKPRPPPSRLKRKASPPRRLDSSAEIESIFFPIANDQDDAAQQSKVKKARTDDEDRS